MNNNNNNLNILNTSLMSTIRQNYAWGLLENQGFI